MPTHGRGGDRAARAIAVTQRLHHPKPGRKLVVDGLGLSREDVEAFAKFFEILDAWDREGAANDDEEETVAGVSPQREA